MKIIKRFQGTVPDNKIVDAYSTSQTDTYSCNYVNNAVSNEMKAYVLFNSTNGSSGTINLNDNTSNYNHIEVIFRDDQGWNQFKSVSGIPGKDVILNFETMANGGRRFLFTTVYNIGSTQLTVNSYWTGSTYQDNQGAEVHDTGNHVLVARVIGYKY